MRGRARMITARIAAAATLAVLAVLVLSLRWHVWWTSGRMAPGQTLIGVVNGGLVVSTAGFHPQHAWTTSRGWRLGRYRGRVSMWWYGWYTTGPFYWCTVPMWAIALPPAVVAGAAWRKRRGHPGECANCGFETTGLPGPVCPECGNTLA